MKTKKLLQRISDFLNEDRRAQLAKADSLEKILTKLEKKAVVLRERLHDAAEEAERRELFRKLDVVEAQRKKGEKLAKELEALRDSS